MIIRIHYKLEVVCGLETWWVYVQGIKHSQFMSEEKARSRMQELARKYERAA